MANVMTQERAVEAAENRTVRRALAVLAFAVLTAIGAAVEVPLPGSPVPFTLQTMMVSLSGVLLGPWLGAAAQSLYLLAGAVGAPVFAGGAGGLAHLFGPTGGYLLAFPIAAAVTGVLAGRLAPQTGLRIVRLFAAILIGTIAIFIGGATQLVFFTGDVRGAITLGVAPFILGDIVKSIGALLIAVRFRAKTLGQL
ncbi:MAG: biotin transporter BioY [Gemmatimonadetes bacterium]|nr:biotin transporter BioY [Gemmatimonadota bacterium]